MGERALNLSVQNTLFKTSDKNVKEKILEFQTQEVIIGLCGPIGTNIHYVAEKFSEIINEKYDYEVQIIQLSSLIKEHKKITDDSIDRFEYVNRLISGGNELRETYGNGVLAELAIKEIAVNRELKKEGDEFKSQRICYIIDSIKNTEELEIFRLIYSHIFYFIGVFSNLDIREKNLLDQGISKGNLNNLINRDSGEEKQFGQKVSDTFVQSDFFLRIDDSTTSVIDFKIERFLNLIFDSDVTTPSQHETAMYQAFAAAGNSACLSRQVGASITNSIGEIISIGWNDVPKFNGGVYTFSEDDSLGQHDKRCMHKNGGMCFNDFEKDLISNLLINDLIEGGILSETNKLKAKAIIKKSRIKEIIEFSRAVHAEMLAIIIGSQKAGHEIIGGNLYCTTYPCHNCARHIVAAGIKDVYYIEPYRKSLAVKLHDDSISEDEKEQNKLRVLMFDGVAPRRYLEFFKMVTNSRKSDGKKIKQNKKLILPKNRVSLQAITILEKEIIKELQSKNLIEIKDGDQ